MQPDLFSASDLDVPVPAVRRSHASVKAAETLAARKAQGPKMQRLMHAFARRGHEGLNRSELIDATGLLTQSTCSLIAYGVKKGWLLAVGERKSQATKFQQTVYRITPGGIQALAQWKAEAA